MAAVTASAGLTATVLQGCAPASAEDPGARRVRFDPENKARLSSQVQANTRLSDEAIEGEIKELRGQAEDTKVITGTELLEHLNPAAQEFVRKEIKLTEEELEELRVVNMHPDLLQAQINLQEGSSARDPLIFVMMNNFKRRMIRKGLESQYAQYPKYKDELIQLGEQLIERICAQDNHALCLDDRLVKLRHVDGEKRDYYEAGIIHELMHYDQFRGGRLHIRTPVPTDYRAYLSFWLEEEAHAAQYKFLAVQGYTLDDLLSMYCRVEEATPEKVKRMIKMVEAKIIELWNERVQPLMDKRVQDAIEKMESKEKEGETEENMKGTAPNGTSIGPRSN